jgi:predicted RNase H-like HicB family nuclease
VQVLFAVPYFLRIMLNFNLTAVVVPCAEGGFTAYIPEIRGVVSEGETLQEVQENLLDALELMLETEREHHSAPPANALHIPLPITISPTFTESAFAEAT